MKIKFGIIGTNFIVDEFMATVKLFQGIEVVSIYSRSRETGEKFAEKYNVENIYTDLEEMASSDVDAVYIASPNAFHCEQSIKFLEKKVAVFCEKPMGSNEKEEQLMFDTALKNNTLLMEGIKSVYMPNYKFVQAAIEKIGPVRSVFFSYCQYSSRYDKYKEGVILNAFKPELSNGSTMDIGLYPTYVAVSLFGTPDKIDSQGFILSTGVDGAGTMMLKYPDFTATINHSKIANSYIPSEITGEKGSIIIDKVALLEGVKVIYKDGRVEENPGKTLHPPMYYEIEEFVNLYKKGETQSKVNPHINSLKVIKVLESSRKNIGVFFPADKK